MDVVTVTQAAAILGVDERTVRHRLRRGDMAGQRVSPRLWLIPRAEVERLRGAGRFKPGRKRRAVATPAE